MCQIQLNILQRENCSREIF
uniref:Uncharacterized protein n=1 Tax=Rhizophora mucronata TaxID=61149 RepID=A0A2P2QIC3_RHIMU